MDWEVPRYPFSISFTPNGEFLVAGIAWERSLRLFSIKGGQLVSIFGEHPNAIDHVVVSPNGKYVATDCRDGHFRVWDLHTGNLISILENVESAWHVDQSISYSPDGDHLALCGFEVGMVDTRTGKCDILKERKLICLNMNIQGVKGLDDKQVEWLRARGSIGEVSAK
jgi:WD40 repeat protein